MEVNKTFMVMVITFLLLGLATTMAHGQGTKVGFYSKTCPKAESIISSTVQTHFKSNPRIAPGILRMHFHDCFVRGCDGSILIAGSSTEKTAAPNSGIPGYNVIDDAKKQLEAACPGVVSCADILALAARDSVVVTKGISWQVPTGRRDGRVSIASDTNNLPGPSESIASQTSKFKAKGLNTQDLVTLVGGHTIGTAACRFVTGRLYNVNSSSGADPSIDPTFLPQLRALCPRNGDASKRIDLDTGSGSHFDISYFINLSKGRGILASDQLLWTDASTKGFVQRYLKSLSTFNSEFAKAMVKMSKIGVLTGTQGEIRKVCTAIN
ncbi:cationic peroxidase 2-like [Humulus lupulus]|uniref:cationic peroxidase 2-like n=1 Tax=Humulus lupulus TaxID=3486 RepID=UPI002B4145B3|nr:cationic peroxidase 2-like [Humulus lupulus]